MVDFLLFLIFSSPFPHLLSPSSSLNPLSSIMLSKYLLYLSALALSPLISALPSKDQPHSRANDKVGYLWTSFPVYDEAIYMHLSKNNDPLKNWTRLSLDGTNKTEAILRSNVGNKGVRDSFIQPSIDGKQFWLTVSIECRSLSSAF